MKSFGAPSAIAAIAVLFAVAPTLSPASTSSANVAPANANSASPGSTIADPANAKPALATHDAATSELQQDAAAAGEQYTCGQASLFAVARLKDVALSWSDLTRTLPMHSDGTNSLAELESAAAAAGMHPVAARVDRQQLLGINPPAILHFEVDPRPTVADRGPARHYAVAAWWNATGVVMLDPPRAPKFVPWRNIEPHWTGNVMLFADTTADADRLKADLNVAATRQYVPYILGGISLVALLALVVSTLLREADLVSASARQAMRGLTSAPRIVSAIVRQPVGFAKSNVRLLLTAAGVLLILVGGAAASSWVRWSREARLEVPSDLVDQGYIQPGQHPVVVMLKNTGGMTLHVSKYQSSCACAVPSGPSEIAPGESKPLEVVLNGSPGSRYADLFIHSNDPQSPRQITFHWNGDAIPWLLEPSLVRQVHIGQSLEETITIAYPGGFSSESPNFNRFECDYRGLKIEPADGSRSTKVTSAQTGGPAMIGYRDLRLTVLPAAGRDELNAKCILFLKDSHREQALQFRLRLLYRGRFGPQPDRVTFAAASIAEIVGQQRTVPLLGCDAESAPRIESCPDWLRCEIVRQPAGGPAIKTTVVKTPPSRFASANVVLVDAHGSKMELQASAIAAN